MLKSLDQIYFLLEGRIQIRFFLEARIQIRVNSTLIRNAVHTVLTLGKPQKKVIFLVIPPLRPYSPPLELSGHIFSSFDWSGLSS